MADMISFARYSGPFEVAVWTAARGDNREIYVPQDMRRENMDQFSLYTDGKFISRSSTGKSWEKEKNTGDLSTEMWDLPADTYILTCIEGPGRIVCLTPMERGTIYQTEKVSLADGETYVLLKDRFLLLGKGDILIGEKKSSATRIARASSGDVLIKASGDFLGVALWI